LSNFGKSKQITANDTELLIDIRQWILKEYGINARREWYIGFNPQGNVDFITETVDRHTAFRYRGRIRCPDLHFIHKRYGLFVIEVDGEIHNLKVEKTNERNYQYEQAGIKLIVVNLSELRTQGLSIAAYLNKRFDQWKSMSI